MLLTRFLALELFTWVDNGASAFWAISRKIVLKRSNAEGTAVTAVDVEGRFLPRVLACGSRSFTCVP